ncbi:MFS general substrate transporter [Microstroma glucosiphilum]|uniref:MFS general substrate transporter n=1 Tax=Pseudomicrostroma glucosiphilum TaxID=1684307 RepID=A0A316TXG2_9BASI|nr:MFS general substrate transporter [Pseudomicrostroma glucosiphilum]PWN18099.1 MFS general substrate transporter [Pseudomicrostroma glucosiphilum]
MDSSPLAQGESHTSEKQNPTTYSQTYASPDSIKLEEHTDSNQVRTEDVRSIKWWTDEEETKVRRLLDWNILPLVAVIYGASFIDRSNVGNAETAGMGADLGLTADQYRIVTTIFYVGYIVFQPLLLFYLVVPAHQWVAAMVFIWGLSSALQATATNLAGLLVARFCTGVAEAGFGTGIALYLGFFFPRREVGLRFAFFVTSSAIASAIAGALAYALVQANSAIAGWRLLFVVEGAPSMILSIFVYLFLPDNPKHCRFLNERQKRIADERLFKPVDTHQGAVGEQSKGATILHGIKSKFDKKSTIAGLTHPVGWLTALLLFCCNVGYASVPIYLPKILNQSGLTALKAQGYTCGPYLVAWASALTQVYLSDRFQHRATFLAVDFVIGIIGYLLLALKQDFATRYGAVFLVTFGLFSCVPLTYTWLISNVASPRARGMGLSILGVVSQCGPLLGTLGLFVEGAPYYKKGMWISLGILAAGLAITLVSAVFFVVNNHRRDRAAYRREAEHLGDATAPATGSVGDRETTTELRQTGTSRSSELQDKVVLDKNVEEERVEALRRTIEVGRQGEDSPFFRFVV